MSLKLEDVTYTYSPGTAYEMHALEHINLEIPNGQFVGIIGHTGSGKSTLMNIIGALDVPTTGEYYLGGEDVSRMGDKQLARIPQPDDRFHFSAV